MKPTKDMIRDAQFIVDHENNLRGKVVGVIDEPLKVTLIFNDGRKQVIKGKLAVDIYSKENPFGLIDR